MSAVPTPTKGQLAINECIAIYDVDVTMPKEHKGNTLSLHIVSSGSRKFSFHMDRETAQAVRRALQDFLDESLPLED